MTSYIARKGAQKKKNLLRQKELALRGDIRRKVSDEKQQRSAEKVRSAQLGVIKALIYENTPARVEDEEEVEDILNSFEKAGEYWDDITVDEIIQMYGIEDDETTPVDRKRWWDFRPR